MGEEVGTRSERIRALNDALRQTFVGGAVLITRSLQALPETVRCAVIRKVQEFSEFKADNDPYSEHDFVSVEVDGQKFFGKIDYYDLTLEAGSEDPADPAKTKRVLTIMCAEDY